MNVYLLQYLQLYYWRHPIWCKIAQRIHLW